MIWLMFSSGLILSVIIIYSSFVRKDEYSLATSDKDLIYTIELSGHQMVCLRDGRSESIIIPNIEDLWLQISFNKDVGLFNFKIYQVFGHSSTSVNIPKECFMRNRYGGYDIHLYGDGTNFYFR